MTRNRTLLFLSALLLATLACSIFVGGPDYPETTIPVSTEAVENLQAQIETAVLAGAQTGEVTLQITEEQITSYIAFKMAAQENPAFQDPQVYLRDGQMQIYGKVERGYLNANVLIALTVGVDEIGQPKIEISTADFGPFPAPDGLRQSMTAVIGCVAHVQSAGGVLGVNQTLAGVEVAISKVEIVGIDEGGEVGGIAAVVAADILTSKVNQRVKLFDVGQSPIPVAIK